MTNPFPRIDPEFKALIPPLSPEEYAQLEQNILSAKKCHDAIILWDNIIIDGHNRFRICTAHGIQFEIVEMIFESRDEAKIWILDNQLGRRNLSDAMKIELAMSKTVMLKEQAAQNLKRGGRRKIGEKKPFSPAPEQNEVPVNVHKAVANDAGVSSGTVHAYNQIKKHGTPELIQAVKNGDMKINTAYRQLDTPNMKLLKRADKWLRYIEQEYPIEGDDEANAEIKEGLTELYNMLAEIRKKRNG